MIGVNIENMVLLGDIREVVDKLPNDTFQTIVTSPPYFGHRKYSEKDDPKEIGNENSVYDYVLSLIDIFSKIKHKLKDSGLLWLNLGDTYRSNNLLGVPWKVALGLQNDGWLLRSDIIWHKPNAMPSSVRNRPTVAHEYVFLFSKQGNYYYDADAIREPHITFTEQSKMRGGRNHFGKRDGTPELGKNRGNHNLHDGRWDRAFHPKGRNKRTVWEIPLSKFRDTHFAVYPEKIVETCILASTKKGDFVLDPFTGSGTTGVVACRLGRKFVGIELVPKYQKMAQQRINQNIGLF